MEATCALVGYFLIQIGTNLVNDACDFVRGADTEVSDAPSNPASPNLEPSSHVFPNHRNLQPPRLIPPPLLLLYSPDPTQDRAGPRRVTQSGVFSPRAVHIAGVTCFALAACAMYPAVALRGAPMARLVVAACGAGYAYTGGPLPLGYHGLGDVTVIAFFGFVATYGMARVHHDGTSADGSGSRRGAKLAAHRRIRAGRKPGGVAARGE